ncbi:MAG: hypothetical protein F6K15_08480 [Okeania sp. SIO2B3]|nr:hypothetical protein [Okeania sp. SIO2B3]
MQVSFEFATEDRAFNNFEGWYIDDVTVTASETNLYHTVEVGSGENVEDINFGNFSLEVQSEVEPPLTIIEDDGTAAFAKDEDGTYWIVNNDTEEQLQLQNNRGTTYTDITNANWDGVAVEVDEEGDYRFLLDGENNREGEAYVWSTNDQGLINGNSGWQSGNDLLPLESEFNVDLNDDGEIGSSQNIEEDELLSVDETLVSLGSGDGILF